MEQIIEIHKNDTVRGIENMINAIKKWQAEGGYANPRETALVITKLEEALHWAYFMIDRKSHEK